MPAAALAAMLPMGAWAQASCHVPDSSEFKVVTLVDVHMGLDEPAGASNGPVQMAVAPDGRVFIAEMQTGDIRVYSPTNTNPSKVTVVGNIPTLFDTEDGLLGIALDPNFATTHWLYAFYSDPCKDQKCGTRGMELSRFTITSDNKLTNKKVILRFPRALDDTHHAAGGLSMDASGVLVFGTGDNTDPHDQTNAGYGPIYSARSAADAQRTAANTDDLRGKVLRIKPMAFADAQTPTAGAGTTYEIPDGNLWEKINNKSFNPGWDASDDISKVRKEIYTFGSRNPYHVRVDSKSGWVFWGEVGPDAGGDDSPTRGPAGHDEWNLATGPAFFGHPYCNGYNVPYNMMTGTNPAAYGAKFNCSALVNNSPNNTGIHHLPPAVPALAAYTSGNSKDDDPRFNASPKDMYTTIQHGGETAIGGPMYRYDPNLKSEVKFPPYYEGKVLFFDWSRQNFRWITLNSDGTIPAGKAGVENFSIRGLAAASFIDMQYGPDGSMYLLKFSDRGYSVGSGPQLFRIEYTGVKDDACYKPFVATVGTSSIAPKRAMRESIVPMLANGGFALPEGYRSITLYDLSGRQVWSFRRESAEGAMRVKLPAEMAHGLWRASVMP